MNSIDFVMNESNRANLVTKIMALDCSKTLWRVTAKPKKSARTNQQNARYWAFLTAYGKHLGYTKDEMHDICRFKFLSEKVEVNGEIVIKLKSTPKTNTKEFAEYCEMCEIWATDNGFIWGYYEA